MIQAASLSLMLCIFSQATRLFSHTQKSAIKGLFAFHSPSIETPVNVWMYVCGYRQNRCNNRWGQGAGQSWSLELLCQDNFTRFTAEHRLGSCGASCCLALASPRPRNMCSFSVVYCGPVVQM